MVVIMKHYSRLLVILSCLAACGNLYALSAEDEKEAATARESATGKRSPPAKQSPRPARKPAATFKPSEKIGADSAVSFPVDI